MAPVELIDLQVPRPVVLAEKNIVIERGERCAHVHDRAQFILTTRGVLTVEVDERLWLVPQGSSIWLPAGHEHAARARGRTQMYFLFVDHDAVPSMPRHTACTLAVSALFRELLGVATQFPKLYDVDGAEGRLIEVLLDQLVAAKADDLHLPMPEHPKLRRIVEMLIANPAERTTIAAWAKRVGASERTLTRLLLRETGMSFGRWRRQLDVIVALDRLNRGAPVQEVALDLGYESASAFITMFKKTLGKPPARYLADRNRIAAA